MHLFRFTILITCLLISACSKDDPAKPANGPGIYPPFVTSYCKGGFTIQNNSMLKLSDGNFLITGNNTYDTSGITLCKINSSGQQIWIRKHNDLGYPAQAASVIQDNSGGIYVLGTTTRNFIINTDLDYFLMKFDGNGNKLWTNVYANPFRDEAYHIICTSDNHLLYLANYFTTSSESSLKLVKCDLQGNVIWAAPIGTNTSDKYGDALVEDANGNYHVFYENVYLQYSESYREIISSGGTFINTLLLPVSQCYVKAALLNNSGNVTVAGTRHITGIWNSAFIMELNQSGTILNQAEITENRIANSFNCIDQNSAGYYFLAGCKSTEMDSTQTYNLQYRIASFTPNFDAVYDHEFGSSESNQILNLFCINNSLIMSGISGQYLVSLHCGLNGYY